MEWRTGTRRQAVLARDGFRCWLCGGWCGPPTIEHPLMATVDHIVPFSHGGPTEVGNLKCAHKVCNGWRAARPAEKVGIDPDRLQWVRNWSFEVATTLWDCFNKRQEYPEDLQATKISDVDRYLKFLAGEE